MSNIGTGATGTVFQGAGVGISPKFSTAAYPLTAGTTGNVLTSDGTNWTSTAPAGPSGLAYATVVLTSAQVKALRATPIQLIATPGAGKAIVLVGAPIAKLTYGGTSVFIAGASQSILLYYGNASVQQAANGLSNASIVSASSRYDNGGSPTFFSTIAITSIENVGIFARNSVATEITGNAANDNTITISVLYYVVTI